MNGRAFLHATCNFLECKFKGKKIKKIGVYVVVSDQKFMVNASAYYYVKYEVKIIYSINSI